jgi:hypothetical protein
VLFVENFIIWRHQNKRNHFESFVFPASKFPTGTILCGFLRSCLYFFEKPVTQLGNYPTLIRRVISSFTRSNISQEYQLHSHLRLFTIILPIIYTQFREASKYTVHRKHETPKMFFISWQLWEKMTFVSNGSSLSRLEKASLTVHRSWLYAS